MRKRIVVCALAWGLVCGFVEIGHAESGIYLGYEIDYIDYGTELEDFVDNLDRLDVVWKVGYSLSIPFSLEFEFDTDALINGGAPFYGAGILYSFGADQPLRPYISAGLGWYSLDVELPLETVTLSGQGYHIGIGFDYHFNPETSIGLGMTQRYVTYDHIDSRQYILLRDINGDRITYGFRWQVYF